LGAIACAVRPRRQRAIRGDTQRKCVAGDQALDSLASRSGLIFRPPFQRVVGLLNAALAKPDEGDSDRQKHSRQDEKQFGARRETRKALSRGHRATSTMSDKFADEAREIVRNRFTQGVVIHGTQGPPEVAFPSCTVGRL
jgi:hypothetical protein